MSIKTHYMRKISFAFVVAVILVSCKDSEEKKFAVIGVIENNTAKKVYLEEAPASMMEPRLVDSFTIEKDGSFKLKAEAREAVIYNLRLDQSTYPVASVINDAPSITLNIKMNKANNQFAESYDVKGSEASQQMKDFVIRFNGDQQKIYYNSIYIDSIERAGGNDSLIMPVMAQQDQLAANIKAYTLEALEKANNPALILFELGFYQSIANGTNFGLEPLKNEKVVEIISSAAQKYPDHKGISDVNKTLAAEMAKANAASGGWVGKAAPDFALPDVNGNEIKLSSLKGKYVLVDFWASWCVPCRRENPNVVKAYQQFKDKNFTVLGVSLDRPGEKDAWLNAIKEDKLAWTHVSDLKFWESSVVPLYHIEGIPFNILVDPEGKIIAQGLRGPNLETKLKEVL